MKEIIKYQAIDGKVFDLKEECERYDVIAKEVEEFLKTILDSEQFDEGCSFSNGSGYVQHPENTYNRIEKKLIELSNKYFPFWSKEKPFTQFNYVLGRIIDDTNTKCLNTLSYKLMTIDTKGREWGQPYFKLHPDEAKNIRLNP